MKKKFKLFATIGSLALAVCMMTIGVLAASTVTLNVNSTVSFDVASVFTTITGSVNGGALTEAKTFTAKSYTGTVGTNEVPVASDMDITGSTDFGALTFTEAKKDDIVYTFTITNDGKETINYKVEVNSTLSGTITGSWTDGGEALKGTLTTGASETFVYTVAISDLSKTASGDVDFTFTVSKDAIA